MAWSVPKTWTSGSAVTAAELNQEVRDNLNALRAERVVGGYTEGHVDAGLHGGAASGTPGSEEATAPDTKVGRLVHATAATLRGQPPGSRAALGSVFINSLPFAAAASVPARGPAGSPNGQGFLWR